MPRRLIVNADDYGYTPGVTRGILHAHREGIVTSTSAMMNLPYAIKALRLAKDLPQLGVGVHLNVTFGQPLLPPQEVSTLVNEEGRFYGPDVLLMRAAEVDLDQLRAELVAQVEAFRATGRQPDHLDFHHPAFIHPTLFAVYLEMAERYGLPLRMPLSPFKGDGSVELSAIAAGMYPPGLIRFVMRENWTAVRSRSLTHPDRFLGDFFGEQRLTVEELLTTLESLPDGISELMCHPGFADEELLTYSSYALEREREVELLTDSRVKARIEQLGIELVNFGIFA